MRRTVCIALTATIGMLALSGCSLVKVKEPEQITVAEVVKEVTKALEEVSAKRPALYKAFDSAEISLETVTETESGGEIKLLVISAKSSVTSSMAQTVYYKLTPPKPKAISMGVDATIHGALAEGIVKASEEIESALDRQSNLALKELSTTVKFAVTRTGSAGVEVKLTPLTLGGAQSNSKNVSHEITLNFSVTGKT